MQFNAPVCFVFIKCYIYEQKDTVYICTQTEYMIYTYIYMHVCINCYSCQLADFCIPLLMEKGSILICWYNWEIALNAEMSIQRNECNIGVFCHENFTFTAKANLSIKFFAEQHSSSGKDRMLYTGNLVAPTLSHGDMGGVSYHWKWSKVAQYWLDLICGCLYIVRNG